MAWDVEFTDEFGAWWDSLNAEEQESVDFGVGLLVERGPTLPFPYSSQVKGSQFGEMRELRVQHQGNPYRVLYAFDPRRVALLLLGGDKTGDDGWYDRMVPIADKLFAEHLGDLKTKKETTWPRESTRNFVPRWRPKRGRALTPASSRR